MLPSDDNLLEEELRRLEDRLNKANTNAASASEKGEGMEPASAKGDKWRDIHSSMAEQSCSLNFLLSCACVTLHSLHYGAWWMDDAKMECNGHWCPHSA